MLSPWAVCARTLASTPSDHGSRREFPLHRHRHRMGKERSDHRARQSVYPPPGPGEPTTRRTCESDTKSFATIARDRPRASAMSDAERRALPPSQTSASRLMDAIAVSVCLPHLVHYLVSFRAEKTLNSSGSCPLVTRDLGIHDLRKIDAGGIVRVL